MKALGSVDSLLEALREEVEEEVSKIRQELEAETAGLRHASESDPVVVSDRLARLESARRQAAEAGARQDWADRRAALEDREAWIGRVVAEGRSRFAAAAANADRRDVLSRWIDEAVERLPGDDFEVVLSPEDAALFPASPSTARSSPSRSRSVRIVTNDQAPAGSCLGRTPDARASFDNGFEARCRRFESAWRSVLAEIYGS